MRRRARRRRRRSLASCHLPSHNAHHAHPKRTTTHDNTDINVSVDAGTLTISGSKTTSEQKQDEGGFVRRERKSMAWTRSFTLPESVNPDDVDKIKASLNQGVLRVTVPKLAAPQRAEPNSCLV